MPKLSDFLDEEIELVDGPAAGLKLSEIAPEEVEVLNEGEATPIPEEPTVGALEAGMRGLEQGTTAGVADEIGGAIGAGLEYAFGPEDVTAPQDEGELEKLKRLYQEYRDANRDRYQEAQEAQPGAYFAGDIAGGVGMGLAAAPLAAGVKGAAALGAIEGLGRSEADLTEGEFGEAAVDVGLGAGLGFAGGKAGQKLGKILSKPSLKQTAESFRKSADEQAMKVIGASSKDFSKEIGKGLSSRPDLDKMRGIGRALSDDGIIGARDSIRDTIGKIDNRMDDIYENQIEQVVKRVSEVLPQTNQEAIDAVAKKNLLSLKNLALNTINEKRFTDPNIHGKVSQRVSKIAKEMINNRGDLNALLNIKQTLGKTLADTDWVKPADDLVGLKDFYKQSYMISKQMTEDLSEAVEPGMGQILREQNKKWGNLMEARKIAMNEYTTTLSKSDRLRFGEYLLGGAVSAAGGLPAGLLAIGAKRGTEKFFGKEAPKIARMGLHKANKALAAGVEGLSETIPQIEGAGDKLGKTIATLGPEKFDEDYSVPTQQRQLTLSKPDDLVNLADSLDITNESEKRVANILRSASEMDDNKRKAFLHQMLQHPAYRKALLKENAGE